MSFSRQNNKNALKGIKKTAHFQFSAGSPGHVHVKYSSDAKTEQNIKLVKDISWKPQRSSLPDELIPHGLSVKRQWYLYKTIREFCQVEYQDLVCPLPRKRPLPSDDESSEDDE